MIRENIKAFEDAHKAGVLVDLGHQIYDNSEYVIHKKALGDTGVVLTNPQREFGCDYEEADKIRNYLLSKGIILKDTREGTIYEVI